MCKKDADNNNVINISYASNALKLTFDSAQIKCKKGYSGSGAEVASGTKVKEKKHIPILLVKTTSTQTPTQLL